MKVKLNKTDNPFLPLCAERNLSSAINLYMICYNDKRAFSLFDGEPCAIIIVIEHTFAKSYCRGYSFSNSPSSVHGGIVG